TALEADIRAAERHVAGLTGAQGTAAEQRREDLRLELELAHADRVDPAALRVALAEFDQIWSELSPMEQARVLRLLVRRIDYDGNSGHVAITFHPSQIKLNGPDRKGVSSDH